MTSKAAVHAVRLPTRALSAVRGPGEKRLRWLLGTNSLREPNEVQLLEFDAEQDALRLVATYAHGPEVWCIAPCPADNSYIMTVYDEEASDYRACLWRIPPGDPPDPGARGPLEQRAVLAGHKGVMRQVLWHASLPQSVLSVHEDSLRSWSLAEATPQVQGEGSAGSLTELRAGAWDPHDRHRAATAGANNIQVWDLRSPGKPAAEAEGAHAQPVRDVDFAPRGDNALVSGGDDGRLRLWDLRRFGGKAGPLLCWPAHEHWVWQAKFNPAHDCLLLSASSDTRVALWYTQSAAGVASKGPSPAKGGAGVKPLGATARGGLREGRQHEYTDHEDAVHGVAWAAEDPWVFASVSYDGRFAVNRVPSSVQYKILL